VHDVIFPRRHSRAVMRTVQARYASSISAQVLEQRITPAEAELNHLRSPPISPRWNQAAPPPSLKPAIRARTRASCMPSTPPS
jgi:hypothetical protein